MRGRSWAGQSATGQFRWKEVAYAGIGLYGLIAGFVAGGCWASSDWTSAQQAAWLQAGGSVLAVLAALLVPLIQRNHARADARAQRQLKARSLAIAISPQLTPLSARIARVEAALQEARALYAGQDKDEMSFSAFIACQSNYQKRLSIAKPAFFDKILPRLYILGETGEILQRLVAAIDEYDGRISVEDRLADTLLSDRLQFIKRLIVEADGALAVQLREDAHAG